MSRDGHKADKSKDDVGGGEVTARLGRRTVLVGGIAAGGALAGGIAGRRRGGTSRAIGLARQGGGAPVATPAPALDGLTIVREQQPRYDGTPRPSGLLRLLRPPSVRDDFSPVSFRQDFQVTASYLDPLLRPDPVTMEPGPWLATRWRWSDDERTITYELRDDVRWHDGSPLTAEDVRFSFLVYRDDVDSGVRAAFSAMERVEVVDETTVEVTLAEVDGGWVFTASTQLLFQKAQYERYWLAEPAGARTLTGFDWSEALPIGTGPWRLTAWDADGVAFDRFEGYWREAPAFARMEIGWEADEDRRLDAWRRDDVDLLWPVDDAAVETVEDAPGHLFVADAASVMFAAFNFFNPLRPEPGIFTDLRVRQALSLAIDRNRYGTNVFGGFIRQRAAGTIAQPWANASDVTAPLQDPNGASALLAEAGWFDVDGDGILDDAFGQRFSVSVLVQELGQADLRAVLRSIRRDLLDVGVELVVETLGEREFRRRWFESRDYDLIAFAYDLSPGFTDFDLYGSAWDVRTNPRGFNPGGYANAEADGAIADALATTDVSAQRDALRRLQIAVDEDLFGLWFGFPRDLVLVGADIRGFRPNKVWQTLDTDRLWRSGDSDAETPGLATPTAG